MLRRSSQALLDTVLSLSFPDISNTSSMPKDPTVLGGC
jgi:hypothetical protein